MKMKLKPQKPIHSHTIVIKCRYFFFPLSFSVYFSFYFASFLRTKHNTLNKRSDYMNNVSK